MRADARERRQRIILTACDLLRSRDAQSLPLEEVARVAEVGIATLYRNFPDRKSLWHACAEYLFQQVTEIQRAALSALNDDSEATTAWWHRYISELINLGLGALVPVFAPDNLSELPTDLQELRATTEELGGRIVTAAQQAGLVHPSIDIRTFMIGLITVSRPQVQAVAEILPDLNCTLIRLYLAGLRQGPDTLILTDS